MTAEAAVSGAMAVVVAAEGDSYCYILPVSMTLLTIRFDFVRCIKHGISGLIFCIHQIQLCLELIWQSVAA